MKKLVNYRPAVFAALSVTAGILTAYFCLTENVAGAVVAATLSIIVFSVSIVYGASVKNLKQTLALCAIFVVLILLGFSLFACKTYDYKNADSDSHYYSVCGRVIRRTEADYGSFLILSDVELDGIKKGKTSFKVSLFINGDSAADTGDVISFRAALYDRSLFYEGKFSSQNVANGIKYSATADASEVSVIGHKESLFQKAARFIDNSLKSGLSGDEYAVAKAMLLGDSSEMHSETLYSYRSAGVAHIFAVSGLHIGFVAAVAGLVLKKLKAGAAIRFAVISALCFFYSDICGFSASSVRAFIMCAVLQASAIFGNRYDSLSSVSAAMFIVLIINPVQLFLPGFKLSFGVVFGLILLSKPISSLFRFLPEKIARSLGAVFAAQIAAIPISLAEFGSFSLVAVAFNLVFIPVAGVIFVTLLVAAISGGIFGISSITLFAPEYVLEAVNFLIKVVDYRIFIVGGFTLGAFAAFYYAALIIPCGIFNLKTVVKIAGSAVCVLACVIGTVTYNVGEHERVKVYVSGSESVSFTLVSVKDENVLIIHSAKYAFSTSSLKRLSEKTGVKKVDAVALLYGENDFSLQVAATRLNKAFDVKNIIYYGAKREKEEAITKKSFPSIKCVTSDEPFFARNLRMVFSHGARVATITVGKRTITACGNTSGENFREYDFEKSDVAVVYDRAEELFDAIAAERFAVCRRSPVFDDGESEGTLFIKI